MDVIYPAAHDRLYRALRQNGAVISEFPMGSAPEPGSFPKRNRIISGMSLGVVVVEAPQRSGALLTTNYAVEQNREVFAVPGNVRSGHSAGCHALLRDGAKLVERVEDILEELGSNVAEEIVLPADTAPAVELDECQRQILALLDGGEQHVDVLSTAAALAPAAALEVLLKLELAGLVDQRAGKLFARTATYSV